MFVSRRASFNFELVFLSAIWLTNALNIAPPMLITEFYEVATEGGRKALQQGQVLKPGRALNQILTENFKFINNNLTRQTTLPKVDNINFRLFSNPLAKRSKTIYFDPFGTNIFFLSRKCKRSSGFLIFSQGI